MSEPTGATQTSSPNQAGARPSPRLGIGLPVHNGATHLRESIDSLLAQDIDDFELVISDNASSDATQKICKGYADRDSRVRYTRTDSNIGAAANFNRAFSLCNGEYFMWASDDDIWHPRFATACVERLEQHPSAVLCTSEMTLIAETGSDLPQPYRSLDTLDMSVQQRVNAFLERPTWYEIYSVVRPNALRASSGYNTAFGGDVHLLLELLLQGDFCVVPEKLLRYRIPNKPKSAREYLAEIGVDGMPEPQLSRPWTFLARDMLSVLQRSGLDPETQEAISRDFIAWLSQATSGWGVAILEEHGMPSLPKRAAETEIRAVLDDEGMATATAFLDEARQNWQLRDGMRLRSLRSALLRVLRPFTERQAETDARQAYLVALLSREVDRLGARVEELEALLSRDS